MGSPIPPCRTVRVVLFRGDRSKAAARSLELAFGAEKNGVGPGPSELDRIRVAGHAGASIDLGMTVYGFYPDGAGLAGWQIFDQLKSGQALPGIARDDTALFAALRTPGLPVQSFDIILPDPQLRAFQMALDGERQISQHSYGFPNGDGDCNCVTWMERLGLPLLTGRMGEFAGLSGLVTDPTRRFGRCV
jgi:hypothetical protein